MFVSLSEWLNHRLYHSVKSVFTEHQRLLLIILIVIVELFSILLTGYAIYLTSLFYTPPSERSQEDNSNTGSYNWIGLSVVGIFMMTICIIGLRGAHLVNLDLLLTFFWGIMIFIGPFVLGVVVGFDIYTFINIYFDHGWETDSFNGVRKLFCNPSHTALTLCRVPKNVAPYPDVTSWCIGNYNSTACQNIYSTSFERAITYAENLILAQNVVDIVNVAIILLTVFLCYRMLSAPVITESMNDIINYLLLLPISGGFAMSWYLWEWQTYDGIIAGRLKSQRLLTAYIILMLLISAGLAVLGAYGLIYSGIFKTTSVLRLDTQVLASVACHKQLTGCCCCHDNQTYVDEVMGGNRCPEWTRTDIYSLMGLDLKLAGIAALISIMYLIGAIVVALLVRISLKNYQSDYV